MRRGSGRSAHFLGFFCRHEIYCVVEVLVQHDALKAYHFACLVQSFDLGKYILSVNAFLIALLRRQIFDPLFFTFFKG